ncbi:MAG: hypothetical protein ACJ71J_17600 [Nitrososphaeraceae archaeon]
MIQRVHWVQYDRIRENNITVNEADYDIIAEAIKMSINLLGMKNPYFKPIDMVLEEVLLQ